MLEKQVNQRLSMQAGRGRTTYGQQPRLRSKSRRNAETELIYSI